jgi:hypothetical protein
MTMTMTMTLMMTMSMTMSMTMTTDKANATDGDNDNGVDDGGHHLYYPHYLLYCMCDPLFMCVTSRSKKIKCITCSQRG